MTIFFLHNFWTNRAIFLGKYFNKIGVVDADPYHTNNKKVLRQILKTDLENIGNYLYLLLQNYFPSKSFSNFLCFDNFARIEIFETIVPLFGVYNDEQKGSTSFWKDDLENSCNNLHFLPHFFFFTANIFYALYNKLSYHEFGANDVDP